MGERRHDRAHGDGQDLALSSSNSLYILDRDHVSPPTAGCPSGDRATFPQLLKEGRESTGSTKLDPERSDGAPGLFKPAHKTAGESSAMTAELFKLPFIDEDRDSGSHSCHSHSCRGKRSRPEMSD